MKNNPAILLWMFGLMMLLSCEKSNEQLILDDEFLNVADVLEYCQGSCDQELSWENSSVWVKGHVLDISNNSVLQDYIERERFFLLDIRNGMLIEVRVEDDKADIFNLLQTLGKQDKLFLKTTAIALVLNEGNACEKGVFLSVMSVEDIQVNL
jgi:hypothetical protein